MWRDRNFKDGNGLESQWKKQYKAQIPRPNREI